MYNQFNYSIKFLRFYQEFFEEDGYKWSLQEVKDKLTEDKIAEYDLKGKPNKSNLRRYHFHQWYCSGNVFYDTTTRTYKTQDAQWKNKIVGVKNLYRYFLRQFQL